LKKILGILLGFLGLSLFVTPVPASSCTNISTSKGIMSVAISNPDSFTGMLDATGCQVGIYFNQSGSVNNAEIFGASYYGVFVDGNLNDTLVNITDSHIYNIGDLPNFSGAQHGVGIYYYGFDTPHNISGTVFDNVVELYQKGGIVISGGNSYVDVSSNTVTGLGPVPFIAQNGIQFGYGAKGNVLKNIVDGDGNYYEGENWTSTGILLFETSNVQVIQNEVSNNQTGIAVESWDWFVPNANNNVIVNNKILNADYGISVAALAFDYYSQGSATANNNKVINNIVNMISGTGIQGIYIGAYHWPEGFKSFSPVANNNKVIRNLVTGYSEAILLDGDTKTKEHANVTEP